MADNVPLMIKLARIRPIRSKKRACFWEGFVGLPQLYGRGDPDGCAATRIRVACRATSFAGSLEPERNNCYICLGGGA